MSNLLLSLSLLLLLTAPKAWAAAPLLSFPVACQPGHDCWVVSYVDVDPDPAQARDFTCGPHSSDSYAGTDIALRDEASMKRGVAVLAAAPGTVLHVRDDMEDRVAAPEEIETLKTEKKACGNGILIDHEGGWQTSYCHLKKSSITVKPGQTVRAGDHLAEIGVSGVAAFPYLHFGVFSDGRTVDPFTGQVLDAASTLTCPPASSPVALWRKSPPVAYNTLSLAAAGFMAGTPEFEALKKTAQGVKSLPAAGLDVLSFWVALYGVRTGDVIELTIFDPAGDVFAQKTMTQEADRPRQFYFIGRPVTAETTLKPGSYTGIISLRRADLVREYQEVLSITP